MPSNKLFIRKAAEIGLLSFLLLLTGIVYGDVSQELQHGEDVAVLDVENMT